MDIAKDIVDKYTTEQIVAYLDKLMGGVLKNYQTAIKVNQPEVLFGDLGDILGSMFGFGGGGFGGGRGGF